ncbi:hypothetical protein I2I11_14160 [Pontibacter sp. 172403-2]|uniref:hypothetical protein n=1 Tax=Pontibacter rufus TaxID=2791028 RepID=UPI0018AFF4D3|nr:hypothetical protein [Pontibacter sp. 172403-2]MBF9254444.1 hypothetical protein [Pontibacter sp. 172403-2]
MSKEPDNQSEQDNQQGDQKNWLEWAVFGLSLLLVLTILVYLGYKTYTQKPATPDLYVEYQPDPSPHSPFRYHVSVHNTGGKTAEVVQVEMVLWQGGEEMEKAEMQIDFAPQKSKREGWVLFSKDPALADSVVARVVSYKQP